MDNKLDLRILFDCKNCKSFPENKGFGKTLG
jgi:hypothetical protein